MHTKSRVTTSRGAVAPGAVSQARLRQAMTAAERYKQRADIRGERARLKEHGLWLNLDSSERVLSRAVRLAGVSPESPRATEIERALLTSLGRPAPTLRAALERVIGVDDLLPVAYFARGTAASHAVVRITTLGPSGAPEAYGTGFLVAPSLLLTNHHVLPDAATAARSSAEFDFEYDAQGNHRPSVVRELAPETFYVSDEHLDFALVAVSAEATDSERYGWLQLIGATGKIAIGESVSIIEHPEGREKEVAVRNNALLDVLPEFLHYATDTKPGASGSPVFNDQWEVVALHHQGVAATDAAGNVLALDGSAWQPPMGDAQIKWVANEGVRVSSIVQFLDRAALSDRQRALLASLKLPEESVMPEGTVQTTLLPSADLQAGPASDARSPIPQNAVVRLPERFTLTVEVVGRADGGSFTPERVIVPSHEGWLGDVASSVAHAASGAAGAVADAASSTASAVAHAATSTASAVVGAAATAANWVGDKIADATSALLPGGGPPPSLPAGTLVAGDVLLYQGRGVVAKGIMFLTNSDVNHAGLYLGNDMVGEAIGSGLVKRSRRDSFDAHNWVIARRPPQLQNLQPVLNRADYYLQQHLKYAYHEIVLLALLLIVKRSRPSGVLGRLIQAAAAAAAGLINSLIESNQQEMICSEFVYRDYNEASNASPDPYRIDVPGIATRESVSLLPGAGVRSQIESGSVLDLLRRRPELIRGSVPRAAESVRALAARPIPQGALELHLKALLAEHLAEVQFGRPVRELVRESVVSDEGISDAVVSLALAYDSLRQAGSGDARERVLVAASQESLSDIPKAMARFFQTAADFVTPADLRQSPSLRDAVRAY